MPTESCPHNSVEQLLGQAGWVPALARGLVGGHRRGCVDSGEDALGGRMEIAGFLVQRVVALPEPFRRTVLLRYAGRLRLRDVARRCEEPGWIVWWRLRRAHEFLRRDLVRVSGRTWGSWGAALVALARAAEQEG